MPRKGPMLQRVASVLAVASFGLMFLAGARLLLSGPVMQRVIAAIPQPFSDDGAAGRGAAGGTETGTETETGTGAGAGTGTGTGISGDPRGDALGASDVEDPELAAATTPGLRVVKRLVGADSVEVGETVEFEIRVSNIGDMPLTEIGVADVFDSPYLAFLDAEPSPTRVDEVGGSIEWRGLGGGPLVPGESFVVRLRFEAIQAAPAPYRPFNAARASAREQNLTDGPSVAVVRIQAPARLCLGNLVFQDLIDDGRFDPGEGDLGIAGVALSLYRDSDRDGLLGSADERLAGTTSDEAGNYAFCALEPGAYLVAVDEDNFDAGRPLAMLESSRAGALIDLPGNPEDDVDHDDNGARLGEAPDETMAERSLALSARTVASRAISLALGSEPGPELDGDDVNRNSTLDFGFVLPRFTGPGEPGSPDREPEPPIIVPVDPVDPVDPMDPNEPARPGDPDGPGPASPGDPPVAGPSGRPGTPRPQTGKPVYRAPGGSGAQGKPVHGKPRWGDQGRGLGGGQLGATSLQGRGCAHVVQPGESVESIAWAHGIGTWTLAAHNHLVRPDLLRVGQVIDLCVPGP